ncbi:MAG: hypothetical protein EZS28_006888 [Streblomastix strix]|uniref:Protein kinase domain-containing protein n=1 Tax=Streblomastix strix TaxID=222440 RepID=A0A5J4WR28_9EUKA|nr:MAG: hypothetical protein EZS28_006888 [Streblomastix strix]
MDYEDELRRCMIVPLRLLGQGAFGSVYYAFKYETGFFAAKLIQKSEFEQMEMDSAVELGDLSKCPFILKYYSRAIGMRCIIFPMEYANMQVFEGMRVFHKAKLVHRDIKCENILLHSPPGSGRVYVKISDFGFAKKEDLTKEENSVAGTTPYMAPELFKTPLIITQQVDLYALGITFYRLITHKYPVNEKNFKEQGKKLAQMQCIQRPSEVKDILLWNLLSQMLEFDPDKRITVIEALQHPYFTSPESFADISPEQQELASFAVVEEIEGDSFTIRIT